MVSLSHPVPLSLSHYLLTSSGWITRIRSHTSSAHVTHVALMSSPCCTLSHTISPSHTWSLDVTVSQIVSQAHGITHSHLHVIFLMSHTQLQALGVTHNFTQSHSACHTIHRVTQPRTTSGVTHNLTVVHTHTVSWWHTPSPVSPTDAHSVSLHSAHL